LWSTQRRRWGDYRAAIPTVNEKRQIGIDTRYADQTVRRLNSYI